MHISCISFTIKDVALAFCEAKKATNEKIMGVNKFFIFGNRFLQFGRYVLFTH